MNWKFNTAAVLGSGAIGLYYGGRLAHSGGKVSFLTRSDHDFIVRNGIRAHSVHGDFELPNPAAFRTTEEIGPVDLVIVSWKTTSNHLLDQMLPPLLHAGTQVLTLQNGLGNCEQIARIIGPERVLGALCFVCINRTAPGEIQHSAGGRITIGEWHPGGLPGRAAEIADRFKLAGVPAHAVDDIRRSQWEKLIWNIPFNGLSIAEGGVTTDVLLDSGETEQELRTLMAEVIAGARALGIALSDELIDFNVERTRPMGAYRTSSMIDFVENRDVELRPIWEEPLRQAREAGVSMPHTERLISRIRERIAKRDAPSEIA